MTDRDIMQQALEALIWTTGSDDFGDGGKAREGALKLLFPSITALRERLAQPEQEPVAWAGVDFAVDCTPPRREWVGLTVAQIEEAFQQSAGADEDTHIRFARVIEAKLKEKNT